MNNTDGKLMEHFAKILEMTYMKELHCFQRKYMSWLLVINLLDIWKKNCQSKCLNYFPKKSN